jgi:lysophospholipase L1-like esterase
LTLRHDVNLTPKNLIGLVRAVVALLIFVFVIELSLRFAGIAYPPRIQPDAVLGMLNRPGADFWQRDEGSSYVEINSEGFRDVQWPIAKQHGEYRIAVLGDSYVEAMQVSVEDRFTEILPQNLNHQRAFRDKVARVMNFGMSGFGTGQELLLLKDRGSKYRPDLVVLAFLTGNDLSDNCCSLRPQTQRPFYTLRDGTLALDSSFARQRNWTDTIGRAIASESRLVQVAYAARRELRALRGRMPATIATKAKSQEPGLDSQAYLEPSTPAWREAWDITERLLLAVDEETRQLGAKLLVVTLSNSEQVHPDPSERKQFADRLGVENLDYPDTRIAQFCRDHDIAVLTLAPPMRDYAEANRVYLHGFEDSNLGRGHWNTAGHRLVAELIARKVLELVTGKHDSIGDAS